jgi:carboxyl-terminal processing protease
MLNSLGDPYSMFLEPAQQALDADRLKGEFEGIGVELGLEQGRLVVASVYPGSPADGAGIRLGDMVVSVDNTAAAGLAADEVQLLLRGPVGSAVQIILQRDAEGLITFEIERRRIQVPSLTWELLSPEIGYVHIRCFSDRTSQELAQALRDLDESGTQALILDLRGNGGGVVDAALGVLDQLLGKGIAYRELGTGGTEIRWSVPFNPEAVDWPLAVLVDAATASSAEIVAAAIQDDARGLLYGQKTFGKGSVQAIFPLDDGSSLHLTVAHWLSSDGGTIEGIGLLPDVVIDTEHGQEKELALQAALNDLQSSLTQPAKSWRSTRAPGYVNR